MNRGRFINSVYHKKVEFKKAVLWMTKEISLPPNIVNRFEEMGTKKVVFEDTKKGEIWTATIEELEGKGTLKQHGQEPQYYYPISLFAVSKTKDGDNIQPGRDTQGASRRDQEERRADGVTVREPEAGDSPTLFG